MRFQPTGVFFFCNALGSCLSNHTTCSLSQTGATVLLNSFPCLNAVANYKTTIFFVLDIRVHTSTYVYIHSEMRHVLHLLEEWPVHGSMHQFLACQFLWTTATSSQENIS
jgi:hypothetical protein